MYMYVCIPSEKGRKEKKGEEASKYHPDLCNITALHARSKLRPEKFLDPDGQHAFDPWQMSSFGELKCFTYIKDHAKRWLRHNRCQLSRCYPKGTRVDSSNMLPHPMWDVGCALVALNYQTFDLSMQINQGKFRLNGGCGYVIKPEHLRGAGRAARRKGENALAMPHKLTKIQIKLIGALHLPKPGQERMEREAWHLDTCPLLKPHELSAASVINPFVNVEVFGGAFAAAGDVIDACQNGDAFTSMTKQRNGLNPLWNEHIEVGVSHPELAVLRFSVSDKQSAVVANANAKGFCFATIPVAALRSGYRSVPLRDKNGCLIAFSSLLCHIRMSHTHLPPALRSDAREGNAKADAGTFGSILSSANHHKAPKKRSLTGGTTKKLSITGGTSPRRATQAAGASLEA